MTMTSPATRFLHLVSGPIHAVIAAMHATTGRTRWRPRCSATITPVSAIVPRRTMDAAAGPRRSYATRDRTGSGGASGGADQRLGRGLGDLRLGQSRPQILEHERQSSHG